MASAIDCGGVVHQLHLALVRVDNTSGDALSKVLSDSLAVFEVEKKVISYVYDGGSNMAKARTRLRGIVSYPMFGLSEPLATRCWSHILNIAMTRAIGPDAKHDATLPEISFKSVKSRLQACITWVKKSGRGARAWEDACAAVGLKHEALYTPVKTRFGSVVLMLDRLVEYKQAVRYVYSNVGDLALQKRNPTAEEWLVAERVLTTLKPVMESCSAVQATRGYLLSDTMDAIFKICAVMHEKASVAVNESLDSFQTELAVFCKRLALAVEEHLISHLSFIRAVENDKCHYVFALMLDPRHARLEMVVSFAIQHELTDIQDVVSGYTALLVEWMSAYQRSTSDGTGDVIQESVDDAFGVYSKCFIPGSTGSDGILLQELKSYQKHMLTFQKGTDVLPWIISKKESCPHVVAVARAVLSIPGSQMENERIFSIAGILSKHRRNKMGTERMNAIVNVFKNLPDDPLHDLRSSGRLCEKFQPFIGRNKDESEIDSEVRLSNNLEEDHFLEEGSL